jgi:hypothetical protein
VDGRDDEQADSRAPAHPVDEPDPEGAQPRSRRQVEVRLFSVDVERTTAPAEQEPHREVHDHDPNNRLGRLLEAIRQIGVQEQDGQPECEERDRVAETPGEPELSGPPRGAVASPRHERGHRGEVIRIGGVT